MRSPWQAPWTSKSATSFEIETISVCQRKLSLKFLIQAAISKHWIVNRYLQCENTKKILKYSKIERTLISKSSSMKKVANWSVLVFLLYWNYGCFLYFWEPLITFFPIGSCLCGHSFVKNSKIRIIITKKVLQSFPKNISDNEYCNVIGSHLNVLLSDSLIFLLIRIWNW